MLRVLRVFLARAPCANLYEPQKELGQCLKIQTVLTLPQVCVSANNPKLIGTHPRRLMSRVELYELVIRSCKLFDETKTAIKYDAIMYEKISL